MMEMAGRINVDDDDDDDEEEELPEQEKSDLLGQIEETFKQRLSVQLDKLQHASQHRMSVDHDAAQSGYEIKSIGPTDSFCGTTISWYDPHLRIFYVFACLYISATMFIDSYLFFFRAVPELYLFTTSADLVYMFVMILRTRTGRMIAGVEERNLFKLREIYHKSYGIYFDVISYIPIAQLHWVLPGSNEMWLAFGRQKVYVRLHFILYYAAIREQEPGSSTFIFRTIRYLLISLLTVHFLACAWYGFACYRADEEGFSLALCSNSSWILNLPKNVLVKAFGPDATIRDAIDSEISYIHNTYVTSLYWSCATAASTGYGDIVPKTIPEKLYAIFAMITGMAIVFGMTMGGMTSMLSNMDGQRSSYFHIYKAFEKELDRMEVSKDVKKLCLNYYDHMWYKWNGVDIYASGFLKKLPESIRAKFAEATFHQLLHKADLMKDTGETFYRNLSLVCQPVVFLASQFIQKSGEIADSMCYIQSGSAEILDSNEEGVIALMHAGKAFGQILLAFDMPRMNSIKCRTNCDIFILNKYDFRQVLSEYPECARRFIEAVRRKCKGPDKQWPMEAPRYKDVVNFILKSKSTKDGSEIISQTAKILPIYEHPAQNMKRRMTTLYSTEYKGVNLPRVPMHTIEEIHAAEDELKKHESEVSLIDFIHEDDHHNIKPIALTHSDSGSVIGLPAPLFDQDAISVSLKDRLFGKTVINPKGKFYNYWLNYMFAISLFAGIYSSYLAFFTTITGEELTYYGEDAEVLDLMDIATFTCNETLADIYYTSCSHLQTFVAMADCLQSVGGPFGEKIKGDYGAGFVITVPAPYDERPIAYNSEQLAGRIHTLISYLLIDLSFYLNILVNLRKALITPNGVVNDLKTIIFVYNKWNLLWLDVLAVFPFETAFPFFGCDTVRSYHYIAVLRLNRCINFFLHVPSSFRRWEGKFNVKIIPVRTFKFIIYIYSLTHCCACVYYSSACSFLTQSNLDVITSKCTFGSWAWVYDVSYQTTRVQDYIISMYWASITMTGAGYGDISASTTNGRQLCIITMILGIIMYGWLIAVIASTVSNNSSARVNFSKTMIDTARYLDVHLVPKELIERVLNVRKLEWLRYRGTVVPGKQTIGTELSQQLHDTLLYESVSRYIHHLPFFEGVEASFIAMLCKCVKIYGYCAGDVIVYEGDLTRNLYIIKKGHCFIVAENLEEVIDKLDPGDYFGELEALFGCASPRTVVAETACELFVFQHTDIFDVSDSFPYLQAQLRKLEDDTAHRFRMLKLIKKRQLKKREGITMSDTYKIVPLDGGTSVYAECLVSPSIVIPNVKRNVGKPSDATKNLLEKIFINLLLPFTFDPSSKGYIRYETIRTTAVIVNMIIVPMQFGFLPSSRILMFTQYSFDIFNILNQYVKAHTAYLSQDGILISHPLLTVKHYWRRNFLVDFFSWLPFEIFVYIGLPKPMNELQWRFFAIFRVNRVLQLYQVKGYFSYWLGDLSARNHLIRAFRDFLYGAMLHHFFACVVFIASCFPETTNNNSEYAMDERMVVLLATGSPTYCPNSTWVGEIVANDRFPTLNIVNSTFDQYIISLYFSTTTLVCVGYGDIHPWAFDEMFASIVVAIVGTIFYASLLGEISATIQTNDMRRGHYKGKLADVMKLFKLYHVNKDLQHQVLNYYFYLWDRTRGVSPNILLDGLPPTIRTSVCLSMYSPLIKEAFEETTGPTDKEMQGFFRLISTHIQPLLFLEGSVICRRADVGEEMFFIQRGEVGILDDDDETVAKILGPGQHFGEIALLLAMQRNQTVKAMNNCDLNVLAKQDLDDILDKFPRFRERMLAIAQDRKIYGTDSLTYNSKTSKTFSTSSEQEIGNLPMNIRKKKKKKKNCYNGVINRNSRFTFIWNSLTVILSYLSASLCIYQACFDNHYVSMYALGYIMDAWFAFDMIVRFHTSFLDEFSTNVVDLKKIRLLYARTWDRFLLDAVANAPIDIIPHVIPGNSRLKLRILSYCRLNRLLRMYRFFYIFKDWEKDIKRNVLVVRMLKFILGVSFTLNFLSSIWFVMACPTDECNVNSWAAAAGYINKGVHGYNLLPWVDSLYWAVSTMTSTGYGDITPRRSIEMMYACFVMVLGKVMIGYVLGTVAATLANDESLRVWYEDKVSAVKHYMSELSFDNDLFHHVVQYYDYMWMKNRGVNVMEMFPDLSFSLRADIFNEICGDLVDELELFRRCPDSFKRHLCMKLCPTSYMPGDYICFQGDIRYEMFILHRGVAEAVKVIRGKQIPLRLVTEGEWCLCESVLCKMQRPYSMLARTYVDVFSLSMESLQTVLEYHPSVRCTIVENARRLFPKLDL